MARTLAAAAAAPALLALLALLALSAGAATALAAGKRWQDLTAEDWDRLERELEADDDPAELETEGQALFAEIERKENEGGLGATMMFVQLQSHVDEGGTVDFGDRLKRLAKTGGVELSVFKLEPAKLVVTLQKGWHAAAIFDLINAQPEVLDVHWQDGAARGLAPDASHAAELASAAQAAGTEKEPRRRRRRRRRKTSAGAEKTEL